MRGRGVFQDMQGTVGGVPLIGQYAQRALAPAATAEYLAEQAPRLINSGRALYGDAMGVGNTARGMMGVGYKLAGEGKKKKTTLENKKIHEVYDRYVTMICGKMGDDITYENELKTMVKQLPFKGKFKGVHPRDKMEKIIQNIKNKNIHDQYHIFNLDTRAQGGSHCVAVLFLKELLTFMTLLGVKSMLRNPQDILI